MLYIVMMLYSGIIIINFYSTISNCDGTPNPNVKDQVNPDISHWKTARQVLEEILSEGNDFLSLDLNCSVHLKI